MSRNTIRRNSILVTAKKFLLMQVFLIINVYFEQIFRLVRKFDVIYNGTL